MKDVWVERVATPFASTFDRAFSRAFLKRGGRTSAESLGPDERADALARIAEQYGRSQYFEDPETFFGAPEVIRPRERVRKQHKKFSVVDLVWPSRYSVFSDEIASIYSSVPANDRAAVRMFRHATPKPTLILIHGYLGGAHAFEQRVWPIRGFFERGLDVALFVLPFHGVRGRALKQPVFPGSDPRVTIEGFRQTMHDLRTFVGWLLERGSPSVGAMGMSLGGYVSALLSTIEPRLSFVIPFIPLACIADFAKDRGRLVGNDREQAQQHELLKDVFRVVSPLARAPKVPANARLVVAGTADRITPTHHAQRLAAHLDAPLSSFSGGHLIQVGRRTGFDAVLSMLESLELTAR